MKKVIIFIILIILMVGCEDNKLDKSQQTQPKQELTNKEESNNNKEHTGSQESSDKKDINTGVFGETSANYWSVGYDDLILLENVASPSTISLFIGDEKDEIGFIYEYGLELTSEDYDADMPKDKHGSTYLYYGKLKYVEENIYTSTGYAIPSWDDVIKNNVKDGIDFYIVLNEDKFYIIFEDLSLEELKNYRGERYYIFNNY